MKMKLYYTLGLLIGLIILIVSQLPDGRARMIVCDVGQGDAVLLIKGSNQVLIDGGPSGEKVLSCLGRYLPFWDRTIELIVMTNSDYDHMNGLSAVLERYSSITFVTGDGLHESDALVRFERILRASDTTIRGVEQGEMIIVGRRDQLTLNVLWPPEVVDEYVAVLRGQIDDVRRSQILGASAKRGDLNERSVVLMWDEDGYKTLLMGDSGFQTEKTLIESGKVSDIDYLKVGHHGSKYATSLEFLEMVKPETAIISVGEKNRYGHPTQETLSRLSDQGSQVQRTDITGDIVTVMGD